jgi:hypothetical protein
LWRRDIDAQHNTISLILRGLLPGRQARFVSVNFMLYMDFEGKSERFFRI